MHEFDPYPTDADVTDPEPDQAGPELVVHVDGHDGVYAATADLDEDGRDESVYVAPEDSPTGGAYAYSDTNGDGTADTLTEFDERGDVVGQAVYEESSGQWREMYGALPQADPESITITGPKGSETVGPPTYDTDADGVPDTAVATTDDGSTVLATDVDGDRSADLITEVGEDGGYSSYARTDDGEWTRTDSGSLGDPAPDKRGGPAVVDPNTGEWTSV